MWPTPAGAGGPQWTQWALHPSAYQDMANDQVDWARLAQQWIMMKETTGPAERQAPPPPTFDKPHGIEGGEAPMDIGKDDDDEPTPQGPPAGWNSSWGTSWPTQQQQQQWAGYNNWPPGGTPGSTPSLPKNGSNNTTFPYSTGTPPGAYDSNTSGVNFSQQGPAGSKSKKKKEKRGYWPDGLNGPGGQMPFVRGPAGQARAQRWEKKMVRGTPDVMHGAIGVEDEQEEEDPIIDAAKRRTLPIWIREGLEKMEREKQKRMEREKAEKEREKTLIARRMQEQEALKEIKAERGVPPKSKFDSDSDVESADERDNQEELPPNDNQQRRSKFHDGPAPPVIIKRSISPIRLTKDEQVLKVRRTMTEVLLEITNELIVSVAKDVYIKARRKAPAKQSTQKKPMAVSSLKTSLGLAMYGSGSDSGSDSEASDEGPAVDRRRSKESDEDSDTHLKDEIRRRRQDFAFQEREIEAMAAEAEERERKGVSKDEVDPERQVERESSTIHISDGSKEEDDANNKTEKAKKSPDVSSDESSSSSRSSKRKHKKKHRRKDKRKKRSRSRSPRKDRDRKRRSTSRHDDDRKRRSRSKSPLRRRSPEARKKRSRSKSPKRRSKSPRRRDRSPDDSKRRSKSPRRRDSRSKSPRRRSPSRSKSPGSRRSLEKRRSRSKSPRRRDRSPDSSKRRSRSRSPRRDRRRERSFSPRSSRKTRKRSDSSDSDRYRNRKRSRSRSDSLNRRRTRRRSSSSSDSDRHRKSSRR